MNKNLPKKPSKKPFLKTTISLPTEVFKAGKSASDQQERSFSNYVSRLIAADAK